jgi:signal transduction histidine kinase
MPGLAQIDISSTLLISLAAALVGFAAYWSNPRRAVNRAFFGASLHVALWLACLDQAMKGGPDGQFWMRTTSVIGAFIVVSMWLIKESIVRGGAQLASLFRGGGRVFAISSIILALLVTSKWFVAPVSNGSPFKYLWGYHMYMTGLLTLFSLLLSTAWREMRKSIGVSKYELQTIMLGGGLCGVSILLIMAIRSILNLPWLVKTYPIIVLFFYCFTVMCITTGRVFSGRQLVMIALQKGMLTAILLVVSWIVGVSMSRYVDVGPAVVVAALFTLWAHRLFKTRSDRVFRFYPSVNTVRQAIVDAAQKEREPARLECVIAEILASWGHAEQALIVSLDAKSSLASEKRPRDTDQVANALRGMGWVTPERLARERNSPERSTLQQFLSEKQLGVLLYQEGFSLRILLGIGTNAARRPFTYPQIIELQAISPIVESIIERCRFSVKIRNTEQLATVGLMGASLAHEIRNPLVSIKTFSQLLPSHYHDPDFRQKFSTIINEEVLRIEELTDQLLHMAAPRNYQEEVVDIHQEIRASVELVRLKAESRGVEIRFGLGANNGVVLTDGSAARQVVLNLLLNGIQAFDSCDSNVRWVSVATRDLSSGVEVVISDSGPGLSPEIVPRLFEPFQTSKSSGFGLGLAICRNILQGLGATISADSSSPGVGATFRVVFPSR